MRRATRLWPCKHNICHTIHSQLLNWRIFAELRRRGTFRRDFQVWSGLAHAFRPSPHTKSSSSVHHHLRSHCLPPPHRNASNVQGTLADASQYPTSPVYISRSSSQSIERVKTRREELQLATRRGLQLHALQPRLFLQRSLLRPPRSGPGGLPVQSLRPPMPRISW